MTVHLYPARPILLVDDEAPWLRSLSLSLREAAGITNVIKCTDSRDVLKIVRENDVILILLDLTMPNFSGRDLLTMLGSDHPDVPVIVLSGLNQVDTAVNCMHLGAVDYFVKTVEKERLITGIQKALCSRQRDMGGDQFGVAVKKECLEHAEAFAPIKTCSDKMRATMRYCEAVASSSEPILITGESGVGKELFARAIHTINSTEGPLVSVNVAGLDDNAFSDTLFGHTKGAFTGAERGRRGMIEEAGRGVLFLDEIGDLSNASQVKLLRLLQEGEYFPLGADAPKKLKAKLVFATHQELAINKETGLFRSDLYYRISTHQVRIPPLRERLEDIPLLLETFLKEAARCFGKQPPTVPKELGTLLSIYSFPGNVRELRAMVFNAVGLNRSHQLCLDSFKEKLGLSEDPVRSDALAATGNTVVFPDRLPKLGEVGCQVVAEAMRRANGNQTAAAAMLGITRQGLAKRLKKAH
uniref:Two component, sigma54 specific, transcriptional regulator, Fis family n=1 Tax=Geobacter sp. (strain M21) TaxID=443144 RepID=C6E756_GEOSM